MFANQILKPAVFVAVLLFWNGSVQGQSPSEPEKPKKPPVKELNGGSIDSIGIEGDGGNETGKKSPTGRKPPTAPSTKQGEPVKNKDSVTDQDGKRTVQIKRENGRILIVVTRRYGPDEHALLAKKHPELADYIELFPKQIDDGEIGLTLEIKKKYEARSEAELEKKHPEIYQLFRRYRKKLGAL